MKSFNKQDINRAVEELQLQCGDTVLVRCGLQVLGYYSDVLKKLPEDLFECIYNKIGREKGTLVVPTGCLSLCNTDIPFDMRNTPSELGIFSEYVRQLPGAVRSFHPFFSYTAVGKDAQEICGFHPNSAFGLNSPKDKLIQANAKVVSIGLAPNYTCTTVHHAEFMVGVPYRYVKEFYHPCIINGEKVYQNFYLYVVYMNADINSKRNRNKKLWANFQGELHKAELGSAFVYSYSIKDFYWHCINEMQKDMYVYLNSEPEIKPYRV